MSNFLIAIAIYFVLPFGVSTLAVTLRVLVDGLAWLIHGPDPAAPATPPEARVPIPLARLDIR
jgi:hypothetical protein